jgi:hypothetical protein
MWRMTLDWLKSILDFRKLPWWLLGAAAVASGAALFLSGPAAAALGLSGARAEHRFWLGLAFVFSSAALVLLAIGAASGRLWASLSKWVRARHARRNLNRLSPEEKGVLARYVLEGTKSLLLPFDGREGGVTHSLEAAGVIYRASNLWTLSRGGSHVIAYNLQPWAWVHLMAHPEVVLDVGPDGQSVPTGKMAPPEF